MSRWFALLWVALLSSAGIGCTGGNQATLSPAEVTPEQEAAIQAEIRANQQREQEALSPDS